jgi:hypothetical protein
MSFKCFHNSPTLLPDLIASEKYTEKLDNWVSSKLWLENTFSYTCILHVPEEVLIELLKLNIHKSSGLDGISPNILKKNVFSSQSLELTQLSNFSVDAFKLEFLMMRSATDEKWLLKLLQMSSILKI